MFKILQPSVNMSSSVAPSVFQMEKKLVNVMAFYQRCGTLPRTTCYLKVRLQPPAPHPTALPAYQEVSSNRKHTAPLASWETCYPGHLGQPPSGTNIWCKTSVRTESTMLLGIIRTNLSHHSKSWMHHHTRKARHGSKVTSHDDDGGL